MVEVETGGGGSSSNVKMTADGLEAFCRAPSAPLALGFSRADF